MKMMHLSLSGGGLQRFALRAFVQAAFKERLAALGADQPVAVARSVQAGIERLEAARDLPLYDAAGARLLNRVLL